MWRSWRKRYVAILDLAESLVKKVLAAIRALLDLAEPRGSKVLVEMRALVGLLVKKVLVV